MQYNIMVHKYEILTHDELLKIIKKLKKKKD